MKLRTWLIAMIAAVMLTVGVAPVCYANEHVATGETVDAEATLGVLRDQHANSPIEFGTGLSKQNPADDIATAATDSESSDLIKAQVGGVQYQSEAHKVLDLINRERAKVGVAPLMWDDDLASTAMDRSGEISVLFQSDHRRPCGAECFTLYPSKLGYAGENIAYGAWSAERVNEGFTNSPGHYRNMVNPEFNIVGIACFIRNDQIYWVESFGSCDPGAVNPTVDDFDGFVSYIFYTKPAYINQVFRDVKPDDWFVTDGSLQFVSNMEIMSGYSDANGIPASKFGPNDTLTREQIVLMLYRYLANQSIDYGPSGFEDVPDSSVFSEAISWASKAGIVSGYVDDNGRRTFRPTDPVSREQLAKMLGAAYVGITGETISANQAPYVHLNGWNNVSSWAKPSVAWALDFGILSASNDPGFNLNPTATATRSQAAKMMRVLDEGIAAHMGYEAVNR